jgi:50S ribosomal subunit-associated GTPase HflX
VRSSEGVVFVVDMTDPTSIAEVATLRTKFRPAFMSNVSVVIAATKSDSPDRAVTPGMLQSFAEEIEANVFFISPYTGEYFDAMISHMVDSIIQKFKIR